MPRNQCGLTVLILFLFAAPADAGKLDLLQGTFAFNWHAEPSHEKCTKVAGELVADFKSTRYRCDLNVKSNSSTGASFRICTDVNGSKEYMIFGTLQACERERRTQASNE
jgi:hypothetical protein